MEANPGGNPYNTGIILDDAGELRLYYRKLHPWVPVEPWEPGDLGIPVCDGPNGSRLALIICHDGMFPEMARECAYKGAEIVLRTAGYTAPIRHAWTITNQANAFSQPRRDRVGLPVRLRRHVRLDGRRDDRATSTACRWSTGGGRPDEIITAEVRPDLVREARRNWGVENNIYQLAHRGYVAVEGRRWRLPVHVHARSRRRPLSAALGERGRSTSTARRAASRRRRAFTHRRGAPSSEPRRRKWRRS